MIPILYEANEQDFTSNGLGRLSDAIACNVEEERNGSYELTMTYPITGIHFEDICLSRFVYAVPADGKSGQPFSIYFISKPINGIVEIHAEHISYRLTHIPVSPFEAPTIGGALEGLVSHSAETNPFTFWTDKTTVADFSVNLPTSCRALLGGMQGSILDTFGGGEYEFDKYAVKLHSARGSDKGVVLRYGKNITDIRQEENIANTYTGVYPYWKGNDENNTETIVELPEKVLHCAYADSFPYNRTLPLDLSSEWESKPTIVQLRAKASSYMTTNKIWEPSVSIDVSFVALWQTGEYSSFANLERVNLCDIVTVYFSKLGISAQAKVVKTNYNVLKNRYDSIELGDLRSTFASQLKADISSAYDEAVKDLPTKSFLQRSVERATQLIQGGLGGYVVMTPNADGEPQEILIMDTDDIQTAVNVIRINRNGIGFSTDGYEGPFVSAWTIDGHFVADFIDTGNLNASLITTGSMNADLITTGQLDANLIKAGKIQSKNGRIYFDLDNNVLVCSRLTNPMPWDVAGVTDPGDVIIDIDKRDFGSTGWKSLVHIYKKDYINYGIAIEPSKQSNTPSYIYSTYGMLLRRGDPTWSGPSLYLGGPDSSMDFSLLREGGNVGVTTADGYLNLLGTTHATRIETGSLNVTGSKNRNVTTKNYGKRLLSSYETTMPMFGDVGQGKTDDEGICIIDIDDVFSETISTRAEYQVFLQKEGEGDVYVSEKKDNFFVVKGTANLSFAWEIKALQKDFVLDRLESGESQDVNNEDMTIDAFDYYIRNITSQYEDLSATYDLDIEEYIKEQEDALYETA